MLPTSQVKKTIGTALVASRLLTPQQLEMAVSMQKVLRELGQTVKLGTIIQRLGFVTRDNIEAVQERNLHGGNAVIKPSSVRYLTEDVCKTYSVAPIKLENGVLSIHAAHVLPPADRERLIKEAALADESVKALEVIAVDVDFINNALSNYTGGMGNVIPELCEALKNNAADSAALIRLLDSILLEALKLNASDVHLEMSDTPEYNWLSYRVDGSLRRLHLFPYEVMQALCMRIKTESQMDASESRRPQDGRIDFSAGPKKVDVRVSTQPLVTGEKLVMRLLDPDSLKSLDQLFEHFDDLANRYHNLSRRSGKTGGIILVTGATGQGKTTTMYAVINDIPRDRVNVLTVENPVEYRLPLVNQIQLNEFLDQKYSDALRALLRQDPDFLVLGETRDTDSADAVLKFAESGHMVMTTLHTNDVLKSFTRLINMATDAKDAAFVLGTYVKAVMNQRLVKKLCACRETLEGSEHYYAEHKEKFEALGLKSDDRVVLKKAVGCKYCGGTGYKGRLLVPEAFFVVDSELAQQAMMQVLMGPSTNYRQLLTLPGTLYYSRQDSLRTLLRKGLTDVPAAAEILGA